MTVVTLFDVDNTLVDTTSSRNASSPRADGGRNAQTIRELFEELRQSWAADTWAPCSAPLETASAAPPRGLDVPRQPWCPTALRSLDAVEHARQWGSAVILSDGDVVFQPLKVHRSGLFEAVEGNVLIYVHKERELGDVERRYPADHYVFVDDKPRLCAAIKASWGERVTTVFPRQGHYAHDAAEVDRYTTPDVILDRIGDFVRYDLAALQAAASHPS